MNFSDLSEEDQAKIIQRIRKAGDFENWYVDLDLSKPIGEVIHDAMAIAVADVLMRASFWLWEDGRGQVDIPDYNLETEKFDIPKVDPALGEDFLESVQLQWCFTQDADEDESSGIS